MNRINLIIFSSRRHRIKDFLLLTPVLVFWGVVFVSGKGVVPDSLPSFITSPLDGTTLLDAGAVAGATAACVMPYLLNMLVTHGVIKLVFPVLCASLNKDKAKFLSSASCASLFAVAVCAADCAADC